MRLFPLLFVVGCSLGRDGLGSEWSSQGRADISKGRLAPTSSMEMPFNGIYLAAGHDSGLAGIGNMVCNYVLDNGEIDVDFDPADGEEKAVQDGMILDGVTDDTLTLGLGDENVYEVGLPSVAVARTWSVPGVRAARYVPGGVAVLRDGMDGSCHLDVLDVSQTRVDDHFCANDASIARTPIGVVLVDVDGAVRVEGGVVTELPFEGVLVATHGDAITVASGSTVSRDGAWSTDVGGTVWGLVAVGDQVLASVGGAETRLVFIGEDGSITSEQAVSHRDAASLYVAEDGARVVMSGAEWSDAFIVQ